MRTIKRILLFVIASILGFGSIIAQDNCCQLQLKKVEALFTECKFEQAADSLGDIEVDCEACLEELAIWRNKIRICKDNPNKSDCPCPLVLIDSDGDGVVDMNDNCINVKGLASNMGCPVPTFSELDMVFIQGGKVKMSNRYYVELSSYYIGKYEVKKAQFAAFVAATNYQTQAEKDGKGYIYENGTFTEKAKINWHHDATGSQEQADNHPIVRVSWQDAMAYCNWLSEQTGRNFSLPSEAQWQFAAMGGNESKGYKYSGSDDIESVAQYEGNNNKSTSPVGSKLPNELGLFDMSGNVWEWCKDSYDKYPSGTFYNRIFEDNSLFRVIRGGGWYYNATFCTNTNRANNKLTLNRSNIGFRLVLIEQ